jgi:histone deacetylase 1/2
VVIYVDDLKFTCVNREIISATIAALEARFKSKLKVTKGSVHSYLGMRWDYSVRGKCAVTMSGYTRDLLADSGVHGAIGSPAADHLFTVRDTVAALDPAQKEEFHALVAKALYLAKRVRPDILLPIAFLSTRVQAPDLDDYSKLQRVLRYLNGTPELGIVLEGATGTVVEAYIDASYGVHADCRSHTGMVITLGGAPVDTKSTKQKINTKSSAEAELIALSDMCSRAIWCREFLIAQGYTVPPARVYQDNMSTIALAVKGAGSSDRTRHVSIRYFWMKDRVESGDIEVVYKPTQDMVADILTKPLHGETFKKLRKLLLNWHC